MHNQDGAIARGLLWVLFGLLAAFGVFLLTAPEVIANEPAIAFGAVGVVLLAGIPGVVLLLWAALKRHRLGLDRDQTEQPPQPRQDHTDVGE